MASHTIDFVPSFLDIPSPRSRCSDRSRCQEYGSESGEGDCYCLTNDRSCEHISPLDSSINVLLDLVPSCVHGLF